MNYAPPIHTIKYLIDCFFGCAAKSMRVVYIKSQAKLLVAVSPLDEIDDQR
jgi:hypothetical protein